MTNKELQQNQDNQINHPIYLTDEFTTDREVVTKLSRLEIDDTRKIWRLKPTFGAWKTYQYAHVTHVDIVENGTVTKSQGAVGRAVVGGLLFGGVGAIIGGSTAKQVSTAQGMYIRVIVIDLQSPVITINAENKRDIEELFGLFQYLMTYTTDDDRIRIQTQHIKPYITARARKEGDAEIARKKLSNFIVFLVAMSFIIFCVYAGIQSGLS